MNNLKIRTVVTGLIIFISLTGILAIAGSFYSVSKIAYIRTIWSEFESLRSEKLLALNRIRHAIGYGGMIHSFKNYVLRGESALFDSTNKKIGAALAAITYYENFELDTGEKKSLANIKMVVEEYAQALVRARAMKQKGMTVEAIDRQVKVNDLPATKALARLEGINSAGIILKPEKSKALLLSRLRNAMGYNGMIHNFKNLILRGERQYMEKASQRINDIFNILAIYSNRELSEDEKIAIDSITKTVRQYEVRLSAASRLVHAGHSPAAIDREVKVNDQPALEGLNILNREIARNIADKSEQVKRSLQLLNRIAENLAWFTGFAVFFTISAVVWLFRSQIINPLEKITLTMNRLSRGALDTEIYGASKENEIGEMARAIEVFRQTARQMISQEVQHHNILDNAADAIITINNKGIIESFNKAAEKIFGWEEGEVVGCNINMLMPEPLQSSHDSYIEAYLLSGIARVIGTRREGRGIRKNGEEFPVDLSISEIQVDDVTKFSGIIRDITREKEIEKALEKAREESDNANRAKSEFLSSMSHELRTPLNAIIGFSQIIKMDLEANDTSGISEANQHIIQSGNHLLELIEEILDLSKIEAGRMKLTIEPVALKDLTNDVILMAKSMAKRYGVEVYHNIPEDADNHSVMGDATKIRQILLNLLSNGIKYNTPEGKVTLETAITGDKVRFTVTDTGKGIPAEMQNRIFVPFERLNFESEEIEGTGIGLTITQKLVKLMDGDIGFSSVEGKGSAFWIELPGHKANGNIDAVDNQKNKNNRPDISGPELVNILYVEDNPINLKLMEQAISRRKNLKLTSIHNAEMGISMAEDQPPDLILLDINLPGMNGIEAVKILKNNDKTKNIPVFAISANAMKSDIDTAMAAGFDEYIKKPFSINNLMELIAAYTARV